jgi:hypothetical protein
VKREHGWRRWGRAAYLYVALATTARIVGALGALEDCEGAALEK